MDVTPDTHCRWLVTRDYLPIAMCLLFETDAMRIYISPVDDEDGKYLIQYYNPFGSEKHWGKG